MPTKRHIRSSYGVATWRRLFSLVRCIGVIISANVVVGQEGYDDVVEYKMALQPFQIRLEYNNMLPVANSEEMLVLNATQYYLSSQLKETEADFARLVLYQFVRDYVMMESGDHFSKIAMNGLVVLTSPSNPAREVRLQNLIMESLSAKSDMYIRELQLAGLTNVINATLLSMQGNEIVYQDGAMVEMDESEQTDEDDQEGDNARDMEDDMRRRMTLLLCLLVPSSVLFLALTVFICRWSKEVNWKPTTLKRRQQTQEDKAWQSREIHPIDSISSSTKEGTNKGIPSIGSDISSDV
jgi:hypothetical protein